MNPDNLSAAAARHALIDAAESISTLRFWRIIVG
jgi:hypothetical protein